MPGAIIHILSGILFASFIHLRRFEREFVEAGFIGTLFPDILKYFILAVYYKGFNFFYIINTPIWKGMKEQTIWEFNFSFVLLIFIIFILLYEIHIIKGKKFWEYEELDTFLLVGILIHLILDLIWIESSWLI